MVVVVAAAHSSWSLPCQCGSSRCSALLQQDAFAARSRCSPRRPPGGSSLPTAPPANKALVAVSSHHHHHHSWEEARQFCRHLPYSGDWRLQLLLCVLPSPRRTGRVFPLRACRQAVWQRRAGQRKKAGRKTETRAGLNWLLLAHWAPLRRSRPASSLPRRHDGRGGG